ncbi:MAG: hypothetical protein HY901_28725 [Deltaproteobacteria bacterium]|nr:hypothetical protein [Deltaproteobacteria bacterium]
MRARPFLTSMAIALATLGAAPPEPAPAATRPAEHEVKAALVFSILKFVVWPPGQQAPAPASFAL